MPTLSRVFCLTLALAVCQGLLCQMAPPAEAFRVLPPPDPLGAAITPYLQYQTMLAWRQDQLRQNRWARARTEADLAQLRSELRQSVLEMIGGLPQEKTDLHATVTGKIQSSGFHIEKVIFQSLPGFYVTSLVYVPDDGQKLHPAILVPAGHAANGKVHYQDLSERLVQRGYIVISWDPVGQGERSQFWDAKAHRSRYNLICAEHAVMGNLAYLAGTSLARWEVWDGIRAVDYLLTRPDVDRQRISLTGTSGGGFQTALLGALDERIKVIIPSCYITALPMRIHNRIFVDPDSDPEQDLFGFISTGVDHAGLLLLMYPRAVMLATTTLDFFPIQGAHKSYAEVHEIYQRFGHAEKFQFTESYNTHQYSLKNQEAALTFLDHYNQLPARHGLAPVVKLRDADLQCTRTGQISTDYPGATSVVRLISEYSAQSPKQPMTFANAYRQAGTSDIASWTIARYTDASNTANLQWEAVGTTAVGDLHIDRYLLHHDTYLAMPLLHFHSSERAPNGIVLWFSMHGKASPADWPQIETLLHQGFEVFSFDFRGLGETSMQYRAISEDDPSLALPDFYQAYTNPLSSVLADYVYNSLLTGRPYFLQMIDDVQIAARFATHLSPQQAGKQLVLSGHGDAYTVASRFAEITGGKLPPQSETAPIDWKRLVATGQENWPVALLMPGGAFIR